MKTIKLIIFCVVVATKLAAQPFNLDKKIKPVEIKLHPFKRDSLTKGKLGIVQVEQKQDTAYYFCKGMGIFNSTAVTVSAKNTKEILQVSLHKWNWKTQSRKGKTNDKGVFTENFFTQGDFGIRIIAPNRPAIYNVIVWAADDTKLTIPTTFKENTSTKAKKK